KQKNFGQVPGFSKEMRQFALRAVVTTFATLLLLAYLSPFAYMAATSLKNREQITSGDLLPKSPATFTYEGEAIADFRIETGDEFPIYQVPIGDEIRELALAAPRRQESFFLDPENPDA